MSKGTVNNEFELYLSGCSIPEISEQTGIALSTLRFRFKKAGILRSRADGVRNASSRGRLISAFKGKNRIFTEAHKKAISEGKLQASKLKSNAVRVNSNGYPEFTCGELSGIQVHTFVMQLFLGRPLVDGEVVHHIDRDKTNNDISNLCLLSESAHARLHRFEDALEGKKRARNSTGQYTGEFYV